MIYELRCPDCQAINQVEAEEPGTAWVCSFCQAEPFTSLPTELVGDEYILIPQEGE